jgi:hypothetical protein
VAYRLLADMVVLIHMAFVLFAVFGGLLVPRRRVWAWLHAPAVLWAGFIELSGGFCPLTPLENRLRVLAGEDAYQGDFITRYLLPLLYPDRLDRDLQLLLGLGVLLLNAGIYGWVWQHARRPAGRSLGKE